jgi:hypothetical protein
VVTRTTRTWTSGPTPSIPATAATPAARRVRPTPPSARRGFARSVACRRVPDSRLGLPAAVPGSRAATAAPSRGPRTRHQARADRDRGQPTAAPSPRVQIVSARTCQTLNSSRTNPGFPPGPVPLPRVARDRGGASTRADPPPSTGRRRLRPATDGLMVPAGRLTPPASAIRSSTGRARAGVARTDPASAVLAGAVRAGPGRVSTTLASRVRGSLVQGTMGPNRTDPNRTGREWRTMGRPPTRADPTSARMVQQDRTGPKWVHTVRTQVRTARGRVSTGRAVRAVRAARAPRGWAATAPAVTAGSTVPGWATTGRVGRTPGSTALEWATTGRARSRTGRTRARARMRLTATGTVRDPASTARTAASGDPAHRIPGRATLAGRGRGRRGQRDRGGQGAANPAPGLASTGLASTGLASTDLAITTKVRLALDKGDPLGLASRGSPDRGRAAVGWANRRATAPFAPTLATLADGSTLAAPSSRSGIERCPIHRRTPRARSRRSRRTTSARSRATCA